MNPESSEPQSCTNECCPSFPPHLRCRWCLMRAHAAALRAAEGRVTAAEQATRDTADAASTSENALRKSLLRKLEAIEARIIPAEQRAKAAEERQAEYSERLTHYRERLENLQGAYALRGESLRAAEDHEEALVTMLEAAHAELVACVQRQWAGKHALALSIPARPEHDSDLIIGAALRDALAFLRQREGRTLAAD